MYSHLPFQIKEVVYASVRFSRYRQHIERGMLSHATSLVQNKGEKIVLVVQKKIAGIESSYIVSCDGDRHRHSVKKGGSNDTLILPCDCKSKS